MKKQQALPEYVKHFMDSYVVTVDPGLNGTGLVCWRWPSAMAARAGVEPMVAYNPQVIRTRVRNGANWVNRARDIASKFKSILTVYRPAHCVFEDQAVWDTTATATAAARGGHVVKLAQLTGMLMEVVFALGVTPHLLPVALWKGQLPKTAVAARLKRVYKRTPPDHVADALGMGLYLAGKF